MLVLLAAFGSAPSARAETLSARLGRALEAPALRGAKISALVVRESDGATVFERSPDSFLTPASNMKILTAIAALSALGPTHRFETRILSDRAPDASGAVGSLAVVGGGDPVLNSEDWWRLAADLRRMGLTKVEGDIWIDDGLFDASYWHPGWKGVSSRAYHAPVGALTANYGAFFVAVQAGARSGDPVEIRVDPPVPYLSISNHAATGSAKARRTLSVHRSEPVGGRERVRVAGVVRAGDDLDVFPRSVRDPGLYAGAVLELQLEALGIEVGGAVRRGRPGLSHVLRKHEGRALSEIVSLFMKYSNNSIAESLVKSMAVVGGTVPGTWAAGLREVQRELGELGLLAEGASFEDGSGLSTANKLSARMLVRALRYAGDSFPIGPEFLTSLPIANRDGTLERRARASRDRVRAKTGLLSDAKVTSLSGLAERPDGEVVVFSILVNGHAGSSRAAMDAVDAFVAVLTGN